MKQYYMVVRLLLGFLFVINGLGNSSAIDNQGQKESQKELDATRISSTFAEKETRDGREIHQYHVRKLGFGGKKSSKVIHKKDSNMDYSVKEEKGSSGGGGGGGRTSSKISARDDDTFNKSMRPSQERDVQKNGDQSSKSRNSNDSQISEEPHQTHEKEGTNTREDEEKAKRSSQAEEEEVVNFIHMDYKGMAHRKPPINNHEPRN